MNNEQPGEVSGDSGLSVTNDVDDGEEDELDDQEVFLLEQKRARLEQSQSYEWQHGDMGVHEEEFDLVFDRGFFGSIFRVINYNQDTGLVLVEYSQQVLNPDTNQVEITWPKTEGLVKPFRKEDLCLVTPDDLALLKQQGKLRGAPKFDSPQS